LQLWSSPDTAPTTDLLQLETLPAWQAWARMLADRSRLKDRLDAVISVYRDRAEGEEPRIRRALLEALAEFAAGAGHELNNPLAVVVGRAQLLMGRETDPRKLRSLRAILTQAQRVHRILRDLMYVARPPEPRPRFCQPDEIMKACLRDLGAESEERGVRLFADSLEHATRVWADPDGLRHVADALMRNALEATPRGGSIRVSSAGDAVALRWRFHDTGRGITAAEGAHLFDPFYCGRSAGRGLGMGLPRAARFVAQAGGEIRWSAHPLEGTRFEVRIPLAPGPRPITSDSAPVAPTGIQASGA
jgi:signal transduction histidine kinase